MLPCHINNKGFNLIITQVAVYLRFMKKDTEFIKCFV
jgi:hypothetical protein